MRKPFVIVDVELDTSIIPISTTKIIDLESKTANQISFFSFTALITQLRGNLLDAGIAMRLGYATCYYLEKLG